MHKKILFVSHKRTHCGVYEFGKNITDVLQNSERYHFIRAECSSLIELQKAVHQETPDGIIYNYYPSVLPWVATKIGPKTYRNNIVLFSIPQIGIIHEVTQAVADAAINNRKRYFFGGVSRLANSLFDYYIAPDPTISISHPFIFKTGRMIPYYENYFPIPSDTVVGSFGFGTLKKGFERIVRLVQDEFDEAVIRFNIASPTFGADNGISAHSIADKCRSILIKPKIKLVITYDYLDKETLLDFLAQNTINVFMYEEMSNRGLSSTIDYALAVHRPIAVSDSTMFRHLFAVEPSICIEKNNLKTIIRNGFAPLEKLCMEWDMDSLLNAYERILDSIFIINSANKYSQYCYSMIYGIHG